MVIPESEIRKVVRRALEEDLSFEDLTVSSLGIENVNARGFIKVKEKAVLAGIKVAEIVFKEIDSEVFFEPLREDGDELESGEVVATVVGKAGTILMGERTALNFLSHLSGVATYTRKLLKPLSESGIKIADTRKTIPGLRALQKYAVRIGGGLNHRLSLSGGILIKDNHIAIVGSVKEAVQRAKKVAPPWCKIEVEVTNLEEVKEALEAGADIIMLDNFKPEEIKRAVELIKGRALIEVSGGINENSLNELSKIKGIDYISAGVLTHSVKGIDFSLDLVKDES